MGHIVFFFSKASKRRIKLVKLIGDFISITIKKIFSQYKLELENFYFYSESLNPPLTQKYLKQVIFFKVHDLKKQ